VSARSGTSVLLISALAVCGACTTARGHNLDSQRAPEVGDPAPRVDDERAEQAYQDLLGQYSQHAELYSGVGAGADTRLFAAATFQSGPFREARTHRWGTFRSEPAAEVDKKLAVERTESEQFDDFFLGVQMVDYRYDDFDRRNSIWRIALVGDGVEQTPVKVERAGRATLDVRAMYPYMGEFWSGYRIRFNKLAQGRGQQLTLRLASPIGRVEMLFPSQ
jgi:hypothetical protein